MARRKRQIVAMGGGGFSMEPGNPLLDDFVLGLTGRTRPRVCFIPTASGDAESYIERFEHAFDVARVEASVLRLFDTEHYPDDLRDFVLGKHVIYVGGGSTANLLAVWRAHGLDAILREAWEDGVVLAGLSAGANCWFQGCVTDSFGRQMEPLNDGLGLLGGSWCPHYDGEAERRPRYRRFVSEGRLPEGYGVDDGVGLHFVEGELREAVSSRQGRRAFAVRRRGDEAEEQPLDVRYLGG